VLQNDIMERYFYFYFFWAWF